MGNQITDNITELDQKRRNVLSKLKANVTIKNKKKHQLLRNDEFIINYSRNSQHLTHLDIDSIDQKRIVFTSLIGLCKTWEHCPPIKLFDALFILPLKQKWLYYPSKHIKKIQSSFIYPVMCNMFTEIDQIKEFIQLLRWKDGQQLIFWLLNDYGSLSDTQNYPINVSPVWHNLSKMFSNLDNAITGTKHNPLILNDMWWEDETKYESNYDVDVSAILCELYFVTMRYDTMQEIIYQSNPTSVTPITSYNCITSSKMISKTDKQIFNLYGTLESDYDIQISDAKSEWHISTDYDPFDM